MSKAMHANRYWGTHPLPTTKAEFFDAVTTPAPSGDGSVATIRMYGPIDSYGGYWGISTKDVGQVLDALPKSVEQIVLRINSPGGEVFEGVSILNMLRAHKATVTAVVDGLAASAASVIAAGCDDVVMSPGTQMMIHSPSTIVWGNAVEMRKTADILDGVEGSIVEVYEGKAGEKDWAQLLADETWLTAKEAVTLGLADRIAVIPDAGEAATVGEDEVVVAIPDPDVEDSAAARVVRIAASVAAAAHRPPDSTEPGEPNPKGVAMSDAIKAGLRERLGVTDADAADETLLAALDEALAEQATDPKAAILGEVTLPEGVVVVDAEALASLQAAAEEGRAARAEQVKGRRDAIVASALADGRIAPAAAVTWRAQLDANEEGTKALLESMPKNTVPVAEVGHSDQVVTADDALYDSIYPKGR